MVASTMATRTLEEIAGEADGPLWFQLYVYHDRSISESLVRRAEASGYQALVLTADAPRLGRRERDMRNGFAIPPHLRMANFGDDEHADVSHREQGASALAVHAALMFDAGLTWEGLAWLRGITQIAGAGERDPDCRGCAAGAGTRRGRHHRLQPRWSPTGRRAGKHRGIA